MRSYIVILAIAACSCTADNTTPTTPAASTAFDPATATLLKKGVLMGVNHTANGTASVYDNNGKKVVLLDPFSSQSGPDLKVYLSKDVDATNYINLGALKSTSGMQSYEVPGTPDLTQYTYVHIWCQQFTVVFARAELQ